MSSNSLGIADAGVATTSTASAAGVTQSSARRAASAVPTRPAARSAVHPAAPSSARPSPSSAARWSAPLRLLTMVVATEASPAQAVTRVALGGVMLPHGLQKAFGLFGGYGFDGTMGWLTGAVGLPWLLALLVILIESAGAVALITGVFSRVAAVGVAAVMAGAVATSHLEHGFFMNWSGAQGGEGFEFHLLAIAMAVVVLLQGGGAWSIDRLAQRRLARVTR